MKPLDFKGLKPQILKTQGKEEEPGDGKSAALKIMHGTLQAHCFTAWLVLTGHMEHLFESGTGSFLVLSIVHTKQ